jgi:hypothetical protein
MAEPITGTAIVPAQASTDLAIEIKRFVGGVPSTLRVEIPTGTSLEQLGRNPIWLAAALHEFDPGWRSYDFGLTLMAVLYAQKAGLNIVAGEVYVVDGRIATDSDAKINTGRRMFPDSRVKVETTPGPIIEIPWETQKTKGIYKDVNWHCKVTLYANAEDQARDLPLVVYETDLSEWYKGANANWRARPRYALEKNALGKAYERIAPVGCDTDEKPPAEPQPEQSEAIQRIRRVTSAATDSATAEQGETK